MRNKNELKEDGKVQVTEFSTKEIKWGSVVMPSEGNSTTNLYWLRELKQILGRKYLTRTNRQHFPRITLLYNFL
jgi:hypothetical protein